MALVLPAIDRLPHPDLHVELVESEAEESLPLVVRGELEVAIAEEYDHAPRPRLPQLHREYLEPDVRHRAYDLFLLIELVAVRGAVALLPALGRPERDARIAVRPIAEGTFTRALFVATRESDRARPSTAAVVAALRAARGGAA
jgi:DNA-binding transcriptional LysR family regulator